MINQTESPVWQLPARVDELLPGDSERLEGAKRKLIDLYRSWGYELILPPIIEQVDSLLSGMESDLDSETFRFTDAYTGKQLAIRSDITPQAARIDAHYLRRATPTRLCYVGQVARVYPSDINHSRNPIQVGAELFGETGLSADFEVVHLALNSLQTLGYRSLVLDLGHVAVLDVLFSTFGLSPVQQTQLIDLYQRKALPELKDWLACESLPSDQALIIGQLPRLMGAPSVLAQVKGLVSDYPSVVASVEAVEQLVASLADQADLTINIDFTELRGHQYHTGLVFSLYDANTSWVLVQGGRYDNIGASFGYQRPATGFTLDLKLLTDHVTLAPVQKALAPSMLSMTPEAKTLVDSLRAKGVQVLHASETPTLESALALGCASFFEFNGRAWTLKTC